MLMHDLSLGTGILLVDDHPIIRFGFAALLGQFDNSFVFYETDNARGAMELAEVHRPRLAILDLSLAGILSLELIKRLRRMVPNMVVLVVSMHDEKLYAERALGAGARGYVMKQLAAKSIIQAVQCVLAGKVWLSEDVREDLVNRIAHTANSPNLLHELSDREITIFRLIGMGMKKSGIAKELNLSPHTVETHRSNIKQKMGLSTGAELYRLAFLHSQDEAPLPVDGRAHTTGFP